MMSAYGMVSDVGLHCRVFCFRANWRFLRTFFFALIVFYLTEPMVRDCNENRSTRIIGVHDVSRH